MVWGAWPFHRATWVNLRHGATTMDTLISIGVLAAYGWSVYALFWGEAGVTGTTMAMDVTGGGTDELYLEVAAGVTMFLVAGRYLEAQGEAAIGRRPRRAPVPRRQGRGDPRRLGRAARRRSTSCVRACGSSSARASRSPPTASSRTARRPSTRRCSPASPCPVEVGPGDAVTGATINAGGRLVVRATRVGADTALARIARLVEEAQSGKADVQRLADRVSAIFVPIVLVLAVVHARRLARSPTTPPRTRSPPRSRC